MIRTRFIVAGAVFITIGAVITACDKKEGKLPEPEPTPTINCDTITYTKHIKPLLETNCTLSGCHDGSNSNPLLGTYEQAKDRADAGRIKARAIDGQPSPMPPAPQPQLTTAQKDLLNCWLNNGKKQ